VLPDEWSGNEDEGRLEGPGTRDSNPEPVREDPTPRLQAQESADKPGNADQPRRGDPSGNTDSVPDTVADETVVTQTQSHVKLKPDKESNIDVTQNDQVTMEDNNTKAISQVQEAQNIIETTTEESSVTADNQECVPETTQEVITEVSDQQQDNAGSEGTPQSQPEIATPNISPAEPVKVPSASQGEDTRSSIEAQPSPAGGSGSSPSGSGSVAGSSPREGQELKTKVKGDMVHVGDRTSPSSESSGNKGTTMCTGHLYHLTAVFPTYMYMQYFYYTYSIELQVVINII